MQLACLKIYQKLLTLKNVLVFGDQLEEMWSRCDNWVTRKIQSVKPVPGRGLAVNFRKKCGEMRWKKIIFTAYFLHLFAVNAVNRGELFIFTAFSVFLQKRSFPRRVRTYDLLHAFHCSVHCANCHLHLSNF